MKVIIYCRELQLLSVDGDVLNCDACDMSRKEKKSGRV
jgi:hypothetical protein